MKNKLNFTKPFLLTLLGASACVNGEKAPSGGGSATGTLQYKYQDVAPEQYGGAWKRVWELSGPYADDLAIDEMTDKEEYKWVEIARTGKNGLFVQKDTTKELRYRFDGHLETPWMPALTDTVIQSLGSNGVFEGHRCIIPAGHVMIIGSATLKIKCSEIIIAGDVYAFGGSDAGRGAGAVELEGDTVNITGKIHLIGERGVPGRNGRDGHGGRHDTRQNCTDGTNGNIGGRGGSIFIHAKKKYSLANEEFLKVSGGPGGGGGARGMGGGTCRNGNPGPTGSDGIIQIFKPNLSEEAQ